MGRKSAFVAIVFAAVLLALAGWLAANPKPDASRIQQRRGDLSSVAPEAEIHQAGGFVSQKVRLVSSTGLTVDLSVLRPEHATGPLPLVVLLGGHRTGRDAVKLLGAPGQLVVAALDYPYTGPERPRGLRQVLQTIGPARQGLADTPAAILLATEWLAAQPWVNPDRMEIAGVSLGAPFAAVAGAIDTRFRRVWLIQGGADLNAWIGHALGPRIENDALRWFTARLIYRIARMSLLEPAHWAPRISPRKVVIIAARGDKRLPVELVEQLSATLPEPKEVIWLAGGHVDRQPRAVLELVELVLNRIERDAPGEISLPQGAGEPGGRDPGN